MSQQIVQVKTTKAPLAIGPYSQGVIMPAGQSLVFVSGQLPVNLDTGKLIDGDIGMMTDQAISNLEAIVCASGSSLNQVLRVDIFLTNLSRDFLIVNEVYGKRFNGLIPPARQTVEVSALPLGSSIELSCVACLTDRGV